MTDNKYWFVGPGLFLRCNKSAEADPPLPVAGEARCLLIAGLDLRKPTFKRPLLGLWDLVDCAEHHCEARGWDSFHALAVAKHYWNQHDKGENIAALLRKVGRSGAAA